MKKMYYLPSAIEACTASTVVKGFEGY